MQAAVAVETKKSNAVPRVSNDYSAGKERFEPVSRLLERFEQDSERMFRQLQPT